MTNPLNTTTRITRDQQMIAGINKHLSGVTLVVANQDVTAAQAVATLQARIDAANAVPPARAALQDMILANRTELTQTKEFVSALRKAIQVRFAGAVQTLADFGIVPPKKRTPLTPEKKALAVQRSKATRAARKTLGPKQKAQIKGTVPDTQAPTPPLPPAPKT